MKLLLSLSCLLMLNCCINQNLDKKININSIDIYVLNYIDKKYCKSCFGTNFIASISLRTILKNDNRMFSSINKTKIKNLYNFLLKKKQKRHLINYEIDNKFVLVFRCENDSNLKISFINNHNFVLNNKYDITTETDAFEFIRNELNLSDLTDYRNVSKGMIIGNVLN